MKNIFERYKAISLWLIKSLKNQTICGFSGNPSQTRGDKLPVQKKYCDKLNSCFDNIAGESNIQYHTIKRKITKTVLFVAGDEYIHD